MTVSRISLGNTISTRDSYANKDALLVNCFFEKEPSGRSCAIRRFGYAPFLSFSAGQSLGLFTSNNQPVSIIGSTARIGSTSLGTVNSGSQYQFSQITPNSTFFIKNNTNAYFYNGTILSPVVSANYPSTTVPGVVTLDSTTYVMDSTARIYGSNLNDPTTWTALNFVSANTSPDAPVALSRLYNYVVAFLDTSIEFFYDNANPTGSPLSPNLSVTTNVGCANPYSVVATKNTIFWLGKTHQKGRSVYIFNGLTPQIISTPQIDRILNGDDLSGVYSYFIEIEGHAFYVLTLKNSNKTLVYDVVTSAWHEWSSSFLSRVLTPTNYQIVDGYVILTIPNHNIQPGDIIQVTGLISGAVIPTIIDQNTISYPYIPSISGGINSTVINKNSINADPVSFSSTGSLLSLISVSVYTQNYFSSVFYTSLSNSDLLLDETNGTIYSMNEGLSQDNNLFIKTAFQTDALDFGNNKRKFFSSIEVIADKYPGIAYINYSDDDFQSVHTYRPANLMSYRSQIRRCSYARRRAFFLVYTGPYKIRFYELEIEWEQATQ